jgi:hypothetical protein
VDKQHDPPLPLINDEKINPKAIPTYPAAAGSSAVFSGDPAQVRIGFAIALQLMGIDAPVSHVSESDPSKQGD